MYEICGVDGYYSTYEYYNPHESIVCRLVHQAKDYNLGDNILDLCCGTGEVTSSLDGYNVIGMDPYTCSQYERRIGRKALPFSFIDVVRDGLPTYYSSVICSFAMHLCPQSLLPNLLWQIRQNSGKLIIITPHKRPDCDGIAEWTLCDEVLLDRVRMRLYL